MQSGRSASPAAAVAAALALAATALAPAGAGAATYCVQDVACTPAAGGSNETTLAAALAAAAGTPGVDRIEVGPVTLDDGGTVALGNQVQIYGEGPRSVLRSSGTQILSVEDPSSLVSDLHLELDSDDVVGLATVGNVIRLQVTGSGAPAAAGVILGGPQAAIAGSEINLPGTDSRTAIVAHAGTIERTTMGAAIGLLGPAAGATVTATRVAIIAAAAGASSAAGGRLVLDQATMQMTAPGAIGLVARGATTATSTSELEVRHVSATGAGDTAAASAVAGCNGTAAAPASIEVHSSILRLGVARSRSGALCGGVEPAAASVEFAHSIFGPVAFETGPGAFVTTGPALDADPRFADEAGGDLHLLPGSPAIEAGDPATIAGGESPLDYEGQPRLTDGDGDGTVRRDIGAFEYPALLPRRLARRLTLAYSAREQRFRGRLKATEPRCRRARVKVFRVGKPADDRLGADKTSAKGRWSLARKAGPGRYYAKVKAATTPKGVCAAVRSKRRRLNRVGLR